MPSPKKPTPPPSGNIGGAGPAYPAPGHAPGGQPTNLQRVVKLPSGGSVTLGCRVNVLQLTGPDRAFLFELIDRLDTFEKARAAEARTGSTPGTPPGSAS